MKKIRITVVRVSNYTDLMVKYALPFDHVCNMQEGQIFIVEDLQKPGLVCDSAWESILPYAKILANGGEGLVDGRKLNSSMAMVSCNDGLRPVSFLLEAMEEEETERKEEPAVEEKIDNEAPVTPEPVKKKKGFRVAGMSLGDDAEDVSRISTEPEPGAAAASELDPKAKTPFRMKFEPKPEPDPEPKPEPKTPFRMKFEPKPEPNPEPKPEPKTDSKTEPAFGGMNFFSGTASAPEKAAAPEPEDSGSIICPNCGNRVNAKSRFCMKCGASLAGGGESVHKESRDIPPVWEPKDTGAPLIEANWQVGPPNMAGGCDVSIQFKNKTGKTIKYISFYCTPKNAVDDVVECLVTHQKEKMLKATGPVEPEALATSKWNKVWYNVTIKEMVISAIEIDFMDGTSIRAGGNRIAGLVIPTKKTETPSAEEKSLPLQHCTPGHEPITIKCYKYLDPDVRHEAILSDKEDWIGVVVKFTNNSDKTIKHLYLAFQGYNVFEELQSCRISGASTVNMDLVGPLGPKKKANQKFPKVWYGLTKLIDHIKCVKVEIVYTDDTRIRVAAEEVTEVVKRNTFHSLIDYAGSSNPRWNKNRRY